MKKVLTITFAAIVLISVGFSTYLHFFSSPLNKALSFFMNGEDEKALKLLKPTHAFQYGLFSLLKGDYDKADLLFAQAQYGSAQKQSLDEIRLAQALNSYLAQDESKVPMHLELIDQSSPLYPHAAFIQGCIYYFKEDYNRASPLLKDYPCPSAPSWTDTTFRRCFSSDMNSLRYAHALIQEGKNLEAQEILKSRVDILGLDETPSSQLATLLLGLSHLMEAENVSIENQASCFKTATLYLNRIPRSMDFHHELNIAMRQIKNSILKHEEEASISFPLIHLLEKWNGTAHLEEIAIHLVSQDLKEKDKLAFFNALHNEFKQSIFISLMTEKLMLRAQECFKKDHSADLICVLSHLEQFPTKTRTFTPKVTGMIKDRIAETIYEDGPTLERTIFYLQLLKEKEVLKGQYLQTLIGRAKFLWKTAGEEIKGTRLLDIALKSATDAEKDMLSKDVERFFQTLYVDAENANMIGRLSLIHDALVFLNMSFHSLLTREKMANYLADAEYMFEVNNYLSAKEQAAWVLKLNPENQKALYLLGLSSYHTGDYNEASIALAKLATLDDYASQALRSSQVHLSSEQGKHLVQVEMFDELLAVE